MFVYTIYICNSAISKFADKLKNDKAFNSLKCRFIVVSGDSDDTCPDDLFNMNVNFKTGLPLNGQLVRMYSKSFFPTYNDVAKALKLDTEHNIRNIYQAHKKIDEIFNKSLRDARDEFERMYFKHHLNNDDQSMVKLSEVSGVERTHLYRKLKQLGIKVK